MENLEDEDTLFLVFDDFYKKHKTFANFGKSTNPIYLNAMKKVKEEENKRKKSVHYLLKVDPPPSKEIDYNHHEKVLEVNGVSKSFGKRKVLDNIKHGRSFGCVENFY